MAERPRRLPGFSPFATEWNKGVNCHQAAPVAEQADTYKSGYGSVSMPKKQTAGGTSGWKWASPKKYDYDLENSENEIVNVPSNSFAVTDGIPSEDNEDGSNVKALPGLWVALQDVSPVNHGDEDAPDWAYHVPQWPPPGSEHDPDDPLNFWWPVSLKIESRADCDNGSTKERWYNSVDKPTDS